MMVKFDYHTLTTKQRSDLLEELAEAIGKLRETKDRQRFFEQLLTPSEQVMLGRRWQIAKKLIAGESYLDIRHELRVGFTTIESVDHLLRESVGNYREYIEKIARKPKAQRKNWYRERSSDITGSFGDIRHRYPLHFLLINIFLDSLPALILAQKSKDTQD